MKTTSRLFLLSLLALNSASAADPTYTNFIRQIQLPNGVEVDVTNLAASGEQDSPLAINPNGARFELWTTRSTPLASFLLQNTYVGTYVPVANVVIDTEDPWGKEPNTESFTNVTYENPLFATNKQVPVNMPAKVRRTRADRPFKVYVTTEGLRNGAGDPAASKAVDFFRHTQSYGTNGTGEGINRSQALLYSPAQPQFTTNGVQNPLVVALSSIAGSVRTKIRGEETFSVWSLYDNQIASQPIAANKLSSQYVQIWPMSDGSQTGITMNQVIRFAMPAVTFRYNDTYPGSQTFAQVYKGEMRDNVQGLIVPGSHKNNTSQVPESYVETTGSDFERLFDADGRWTMELLTISPFDTIRLAYVSFTLDRTMVVNGSFTTIE
ncbi:MAG: hypothetical protein V4584_05135 [Verrucomicrobiota bacterium]